MARVAERCLGKFIDNVQHLTNIAWALSTADQPDALLFVALARAAERSLGGFSAQGLANTGWALATADRSDALLFAALSRAAERSLGEFSA